MIRIRLDDATRAELQSLRRTELPAVSRGRLEMLFLSEAGWLVISRMPRSRGAADRTD